MTENGLTPTIIRVDNVKKTFKIPLEGSTGIKQKLINNLKGRKGYRVFTPLDGISLDIKKGDFFGIVGKNGSGKSTLLKTIAGIYLPNQGSVHVDGKLVPFIELGVGFNPELSGRENVYLNGALLGFSHKEIDSMYNDIVDFAELHDFMDERLKNYSSGMQVRLAFSVAIRAQGDILLLDEVLAVGDEDFQRKCYSYFNELKRNKKTVVLVTHDMSAVERFCNKAVMIEDGKIAHEGKPHQVAAQYSRANFGDDKDKRSETQSDIKVELLNSNGKKANKFGYNEEITIRLKWSLDDIHVGGVAIYREDGQYIFGPNTYQDKHILTHKNQLEYVVKLNLNEGRYFIKAGIGGENDVDWMVFLDNGPTFTVERDYDHGRWGGTSKLEYKWK
jgi:ABC-2 type transport system ATP-binding protein